MKDYIYQGFDENQWEKLQDWLKKPLLIADGGYECFGHVQVGNCMFDISAYYAVAESGPVVLVDCYAPHNSDLDGDTMEPFGKAFAYDFYSEMEIVIPAAEALSSSFPEIKDRIEDGITQRLSEKGNEWFLSQASVDTGFWHRIEIASSLDKKVDSKHYYPKYNSLQRNIIVDAELSKKIPEVSIWLNEGYGPGGWEDNEKGELFSQEIALFMRDQKYTVTLPPTHSGACPEAVKEGNHLYCHPQQISGHMESKDILPLAVSLQEAGFHVTGISLTGDLYIGSPKQVEAAYDMHADEIDELLIKAVNRFPFSPVEKVGEQIAIRLAEPTSYIPSTPKYVEKYLNKELTVLEQRGVIQKEPNGAYKVPPVKKKSAVR